MEDLLKKTEEHVVKLYEKYANDALVYHNLEHTKKVVSRVEEIVAHMQVSAEEILPVKIAAWFHDTGHLFTEIPGHEEKSIELMRDFLSKHGASEELIDKVAGCIKATRWPHEPKNEAEEIICDADTYHFGLKEFWQTNKQVKKECKLRNYTTVLSDWQGNTLELLQTHHFFTQYCRALLEAQKQRNIEKAKQKLLKKASTQHFDPEEPEANDPKISKQKFSLITRGIQTMLRLTSENHLELSNMADGKANILISVNSIIISVILSVLVRKLEVDKHLTIPTLIFLGFSLTTIVLAILATRPKVTEGRFTKTDVQNKKINLLFFGNFHKSTLDEYQWAMSVLMKDKDYLYGSLVKDIHQLGVILGRKYRLIRLAYTVFMIGLVVSVVAFVVATLFAKSTQPTIVTMPSGTPL